MEAFEHVLAALRTLIVAELDSTSPARFERAAKICMQAHAIVRMNVQRVADMTEENAGNNNFVMGNVGYDINVNQGEIMGAPVMAMVGHRHPAPPDMIDLVREAVVAIAPLMPKPNAPGPEVEIERLVKLRDLATQTGRSTEKLNAQIAVLFATAEASFAPSAPLALPETKNVDESVPVVDSIVLRRREAGSDGFPPLPGDCDEGDGGRAEGDRSAAVDGTQERVAQ